ncbi:MAG TPA: methyltransferase domain-containing protein [Fimbriimonadales bacterium]|nr:methyltransferase domain-containing protein [Fimbriimonadales bacterium]
MAISIPKIDQEQLRCEIRKEYADVARSPKKGFHFHTGLPLAEILGYPNEFIDKIPARSLDSFAGTGNPFALGEIKEGMKVVDIGCGAGFDSLIASVKVGKNGRVMGIDMTPEMLEKARASAEEMGLSNIEFIEGYAEELPVPDGWADVVISNGVVNLCPNKLGVFHEMYRVLKKGGRIQIGDIIVQKAVPEDAKEYIELWTG